MNRIIKKVNDNGTDIYKCVLEGTEQCLLIHKNCANECTHCQMMQKIMEKLYLYESIEYDDTD